MTPSLETKTEVFIICPNCGEDRKRIDHLCGKGPTCFGPWWCGECGAGYSGKVSATNEVDITVEPARRERVKTWDLLRVGDTGLYFVVENWWDADYKISTAAYYYDESTCPTNWTGKIAAVIEDGDDDPHGFACYVRSAPRLTDEDNADWREIFPEAFGPTTIDGDLATPQIEGGK